MNAMMEEELEDQQNITIDSKKEIAAVTQSSLTEVNYVLTHFRMSKKLHRVLKVRREEGAYLPETQDELKKIM